MNSFFLIFIGIPAIEIFLMIKIGGEIGALNTVGLVFITAAIGLYFAKIQGLQILKQGMVNIYQDKAPIYEIMSGASIGLAAVLLIIPGFFTDVIGFLFLLPITRKIIINFFVRGKALKKEKSDKIFDGEIVEKKKDEL